MLRLHQRNQSRVMAAGDSQATDQVCVSTVTLEEQIGGWSALTSCSTIRTMEVAVPRFDDEGGRSGDRSGCRLTRRPR